MYEGSQRDDVAHVERVGFDAVLVEIYNETHEQIVMQAEGNYWIGLTDIAQEGNWTWESGKLLDPGYTFWSTDEPNGDVAQNCVAIMDKNYHRWSDEFCDALMSPLCSSGFPASICPYKFQYSPEMDRCYHFGDYAYQKWTWQAAYDKCLEYGGYLVEVDNQFEQDIISNLTGIHEMVR